MGTSRKDGQVTGLNKPFAAYSGTGPYVFVCYAHKDAPAVYADLVELKNHGVNVWYDEGIPAGTAWRREIATSITGARKFLFYISKASLTSTHCLREVDFAINHDEEILPIYLEDCDLPAELELVLHRVQALFRAKDDRYMEHLLAGLEGKRPLVARPPKVTRRRRLGLALLLIVAALLPLLWLQWDRMSGTGTTGSDTSAVPSAYDRYVEGLGRMDRWDKDDNLEKAIGLFKQAAGIDPEFALAYARLAEALRLRYSVTRDEPSLQEAADNANKAARLNPGLAPVQVALGQVLAAQGNIDLASAAIERALAIDPNDATANQAMAKVYERRGRLDDADTAFQKAVALAPESLVIRDSYANFLYRQSRFADAAEQWRVVLRLAPDHFGALVNLGAAVSDMGKVSEAISLYERALEVKPNHTAYLNLGTAYLRARRYPDAVKMLEQALAIDDSDWLAWGNLGYAYAWGGHDARAQEAFAHAIQLAEKARKDRPRDPYVHSDLGSYYARTGQADLALQRLATAMTLAPESPEILVSGAEVYELTGQHDRAIELAAKSLERGLPRQQLESNPDLASLLTDPRLQARQER